MKESPALKNILVQRTDVLGVDRDVTHVTRTRAIEMVSDGEAEWLTGHRGSPLRVVRLIKSNEYKKHSVLPKVIHQAYNKPTHL